MIELSKGDSGAVRVLEADPELADPLDDDELEEARRVLVAPTVILDEGLWRPKAATPASRGHLGALVLDGLLCREVCIAGRPTSELVGPGDLIRPWDHLGLAEAGVYEIRWRVLETARVALLGRRFSEAAARWPTLTSAFVSRTVTRSQSLALSLAIGCTTGLDKRLLILFWQLAGRWGRVRTDGIMVPIPLTHELIGRLVGARRPSVSTTLKQLESQGRLARLHDGGWLISRDSMQGLFSAGHGDSPDEAAGPSALSSSDSERPMPPAALVGAAA